MGVSRAVTSSRALNDSQLGPAFGGQENEEASVYYVRFDLIINPIRYSNGEIPEPGPNRKT